MPGTWLGFPFIHAWVSLLSCLQIHVSEQTCRGPGADVLRSIALLQSWPGKRCYSGKRPGRSQISSCPGLWPPVVEGLSLHSCCCGTFVAGVLGLALYVCQLLMARHYPKLCICRLPSAELVATCFTWSLLKAWGPVVNCAFVC